MSSYKNQQIKREQSKSLKSKNTKPTDQTVDEIEATIETTSDDNAMTTVNTSSKDVHHGSGAGKKGSEKTKGGNPTVPENKKKQSNGRTQFNFSRLSHCDTCEDVFKTQVELEDHKLNVHAEDEEMAEISNKMEDMEIVQEEGEVIGKFKCKLCKLVQNTKRKLWKHMENHHEEADLIRNGDFAIEECPLTPNEESHVRQVEEDSQNIIKCALCDEIFTSKNKMGQHRRENHPTYKPCRNIDQCIYQIDCFYSHTPIPQGLFRCFHCGKEFESLNIMMIHKKENHKGVKTCQRFIENKCTKSA